MNIFDRNSRCPLEALRLFSLQLVHTIFDQEDFKQVKQKVLPEDRRERFLVPQVLFSLYILTPLADSFSHALGFLRRLADSVRTGNRPDPFPVSDSAFCQARERLPFMYLKLLFTRLVEKFIGRFQEQMTWKGYQLLGVDGTCVPLPNTESNRNRFGAPSGSTDSDQISPQARLLGLVNLFTGLCIHYRVGAYTDSERSMCEAMLGNLSGWFHDRPSLLLLDRGFFGHKMILSLLNSDGKFLMRVCSGIGKFETITHIGDGDRFIRVRTSPDLRKQDPSLPATFTVRMVRFQIPGFRPMRVITNLDPEEASTREVAGLYWWRWRIEVFFDEIKNTLSVANLRSKDPEGIKKEVSTQITFNNMVRFVMTEATRSEDLPTIRFSFTKSARALKETLVLMAAHQKRLLDQEPSKRTVDRLYGRLLQEIRSYRIPERPMRHHGDNQPRKKYQDPVDKCLYFFKDYEDFREVSDEFVNPNQLIDFTSDVA